jgi:NH3-dependent NAD+ synthetase
MTRCSLSKGSADFKPIAHLYETHVYALAEHADHGIDGLGL